MEKRMDNTIYGVGFRAFRVLDLSQAHTARH